MRFRRYSDATPIILFVAAVVLLFLIVAKIAYAAGPSATLSWVHPTTYIDNSALAAADIKETLIVWRRPTGAQNIIGQVRVAAPATTVIVPGLVCGNFNFTAATVLKTSEQSVDAGPVLYSTGVACAPNPPSGLAAH